MLTTERESCTGAEGGKGRSGVVLGVNADNSGIGLREGLHSARTCGTLHGPYYRMHIVCSAVDYQHRASFTSSSTKSVSAECASQWFIDKSYAGWHDGAGGGCFIRRKSILKAYP